MYFASLQELLLMNGHGSYVWGSYAIGFAVLAVLVCQPLWRHAQLRREILQHADSAGQ